MNKFLIAIALVISFSLNTFAAAQWATTPNATTFSEFKFFKQQVDKKTGIVSFAKQKDQSFELTGKFEGDKTQICYGSTKPAGESIAKGVGCVLKAVGATKCEEVQIEKCMADTSVKPVTK